MKAYTIIIADQNTQGERELGAALQQNKEIATPYETFHLSEVGRLKECIRAEPAIGVLVLADSLQEAATIADVVKTAALMAAGDTAIEIISTRSTDEEALALPPTLYREWTGTGMGAIAAGEIVRYGDTLYRCPSGVTTPLDHQKPGGEGMLAVYAPIRPGTEDEILPWMSGEVVSIGTKRIDPTDGKVYEAIQNPGANIWEPHIVPAIWRLVEATAQTQTVSAWW